MAHVGVEGWGQGKNKNDGGVLTIRPRRLRADTGRIDTDPRTQKKCTEAGTDTVPCQVDAWTWTWIPSPARTWTWLDLDSDSKSGSPNAELSAGQSRAEGARQSRAELREDGGQSREELI